MIDPQDKELDKILETIMQLKESGFKGKLVVYVKDGLICKNCDVVTEVNLTEN